MTEDVLCSIRIKGHNMCHNNLNDGGYCISLGSFDYVFLNRKQMYGRANGWKLESYNNDMGNKMLPSLLFNHTQYEI